jgi:hypothetical protein
MQNLNAARPRKRRLSVLRPAPPTAGCHDEFNTRTRNRRRLSRTASPPPSPNSSEGSDIGSTSMARTAPPTDPGSFSLSSSSSSSSSTTTTTTVPRRFPPLSTCRPGISYVPHTIPPSVLPLPSGPRALRAGLGIGVGTVPAAGATLHGSCFYSYIVPTFVNPVLYDGARESSSSGGTGKQYFGSAQVLG